MSGENLLRLQIRALLLSGVLPTVRANKVFGGSGSGGAVCDCCGDVIEQSDVEYEIEVRSPSSKQYLVSHVRCYQIWSDESCKIGASDCLQARPD